MAAQCLAWSPQPGLVCGTYPGRIHTELGLHRQFVTQRARRGFRPQAVSPPAAADQGDIAVMADDGTLVNPVNPFDLDQHSLTFTPSAQGYTVSAGPSLFDSAAATNGFLLNPPPAGNPQNIGDDGVQEVPLGFSFSFFGNSYSSIFIHSDGNLTFAEPDAASSARSLGRFLGGPPRIAPYFSDLNPSVVGQLTYLSSADRSVVSWSSVPDFASFGLGPRETFQVVLTPDGVIQFSYSGIAGRESVVGISPGDLTLLPGVPDLSAAAGNEFFTGPVAEVFTPSTLLDLPAVAQRFYKTHEDAYDFLVVFTTFNFDLGGAFAFEANVANEATGIGAVFVPPVFDHSRQFGSERLESMLNMGNLSRYPSDPAAAFFGGGVASTLSILTHEAGHRFLAYITIEDEDGNLDSTALLGRGEQHWSFFFNTEASVMEGNRIRDDGNGTFTTTGAVEHFSDVDQYLMGLRAPQEVGPTFLVDDVSSVFSRSSPPQIGARFTGQRQEIFVQQIVDANGPRVPNSVIAPKRFNFAFVLVVPRGSSATPGQVAQLDRIRREWEPFFDQATSFRATVNTSLVRGLRLSPSPLGLLLGTQWEGRVDLLSAASADTTVTLASSNPGAVSVPESVVVPGGGSTAAVPIAASATGRAVLTASAPGFEARSVVVEVLPAPSAASLSLSITGGDQQASSPGIPLPQPLEVALLDFNQIPYAGAGIEFTVTGGEASLSASQAATNGTGRASVTLTPDAFGPITVAATVPGTSLAADFSLQSVGGPAVPQGGIVNGASFAPSAAAFSPGAILSIFGTNLSAAPASASAVPLPTNLGNTTVRIDGLPAPLFFVSSGQINFQLPFEAAGSTVSVVVENGASSSPPVTVPLGGATPGIFSHDSSGSGPGAITNAITQLPVNEASPAEPGDFVQIFATGLGAVVPPVPSSQAAPLSPLSHTTAEVSVTMNGVPATVNFAGLAPGFVGVYQVNAQVPEGISGTVSVVVLVNGEASNTVTMEARQAGGGS